MNAIGSIPKPCRTVAEWLASHEVTHCPAANAMGLSELEKHFGFAPSNQTFIERCKQQAANQVRAKRQKRLRFLKKSRR